MQPAGERLFLGPSLSLLRSSVPEVLGKMSRVPSRAQTLSHDISGLDPPDPLTALDCEG